VCVACLLCVNNEQTKTECINFTRGKEREAVHWRENICETVVVSRGAREGGYMGRIHVTTLVAAAMWLSFRRQTDKQTDGQHYCIKPHFEVCVQHGLTSHSADYRSFQRRFYRSDEPTSSVTVLKDDD